MVPVWYWVVSAVLLVWNAVGCLACFSQMTMNAEKLARLPVEQRAAWTAMPATAEAAYVVAVGAGLLGAIALLCRCLAAGPLFVASLVAVIVQFGWFFVVYRGASKLGPSSLAFPAVIAFVAVAQIGFACWAKTAGLLG
ncbi:MULTISPECIES: hypothetical protein [unclassified Sphingomonas]|uniref:hypothetical protein n=1 Tax=unclassified Sphingomonas TaxID=196159 RepID=UPI0006F76811|nr:MULTISPECIES: hypothetical protein [unclassified Sphingomonas]KQX20363.1 hypothetical protein ASD17_09840 [Sphingomonas sp. Root1294]KQY67612.1 hypothetical protein ASD39_09900 [Sphingomonas sp. Root50]KRB90800.1 hypothetical protein ASE22_10905 [Sphingomonas sp. Root720]